MKLVDCQVRDKVSTGATHGDSTSKLQAAQGWELVADYTKRVVFATKGEVRRIVPFENCAYMIPMADGRLQDPEAGVRQGPSAIGGAHPSVGRVPDSAEGDRRVQRAASRRAGEVDRST